MKNNELFDLLGEIDDKFYEEAREEDPQSAIKINLAEAKRPLWQSILPIAACLVLAVGAGIAVFSTRSDQITPPNGPVVDYIENYDADIEACKKAALEENEALRELEQDGALRMDARKMDINCDGEEEIVLLTNVANYGIRVFSKTEDGVKETGVFAQDKDQSFLSNLDNLYEYDADGEHYWYYSFDFSGRNSMSATVAAAVKFDGENYNVEYMLAYGKLTFGDGALPEDNFFRKGWNYSDIMGTKSVSMTQEEFKVLWEKYPMLPAFKAYVQETPKAFSEEYPLLDTSQIPTINDRWTEWDKGLEKARLSVIEYGEYRIWLLGETIFRFPDEDPNMIHVNSLYLGLVKDDELISADGFHIFSTASDGVGLITLDPREIDKRIRLYELDDGPVVVFGYRSLESYVADIFGDESAFIAVKGNEVLTLMGSLYADGSGFGFSVGASNDLTISGNSLIDNRKGLEYRFNHDVFESNPYDIPHFTTRGIDPTGQYPTYNGATTGTLPNALLATKPLDDGQLWLIGNNVKTTNGEIQCSEVYAAMFKDGVLGEKFQVGINSFNADNLSEYVRTFEMKDGSGFALYHELLDPEKPNFEHAALYAVKDGKIVVLRYEHDYGPVVSGTPTYVGKDFELISNENTIVLDQGYKIVIDFDTNIFSIVDTKPVISNPY